MDEHCHMSILSSCTGHTQVIPVGRSTKTLHFLVLIIHSISKNEKVMNMPFLFRKKWNKSYSHFLILFLLLELKLGLKNVNEHWIQGKAIFQWLEDREKKLSLGRHWHLGYVWIGTHTQIKVHRPSRNLGLQLRRERGDWQSFILRLQLV